MEEYNIVKNNIVENNVVKNADGIIKDLGTFGLTPKELAIRYGIEEEVAKIIIRAYSKGVQLYASDFYRVDEELKNLRKEAGNAATNLLKQIYKEN